MTPDDSELNIPHDDKPVPSEPAPPTQSDLPAPHKPADYVASTAEEPTPVEPAKPVLPDPSNMFQPTAPPGPPASHVVSGDGGLSLPTPAGQPDASQFFATDP